MKLFISVIAALFFAGLSIVALIIVIGVGVGAVRSCGEPTYVAKAYDVKNGMTKQQVIGIMGSEYKTETTPGADRGVGVPGLQEGETDLIWEGFRGTAAVRFDRSDRAVIAFKLEVVPAGNRH